MPDIPWTAIGAGGAASIATLIVIGIFAGRAWAGVRPFVTQIVDKVNETLDRWQQHMDRTEAKTDAQQTLCQINTVTLKKTDAKTDANLQLWKKACDILRHAAPEVINNQQLVDEVQRKVDEMERIAREAE